MHGIRIFIIAYVISAINLLSFEGNINNSFILATPAYFHYLIHEELYAEALCVCQNNVA